jgi:hypothetical protein
MRLGPSNRVRKWRLVAMLGLFCDLHLCLYGFENDFVTIGITRQSITLVRSSWPG